MILPIEGLRDIQRLTIKRFGPGITAEIILDCAEIDQIIGYVGMALTVELAVHRQDALVERLRCGVMS